MQPDLVMETQRNDRQISLQINFYSYGKQKTMILVGIEVNQFVQICLILEVKSGNYP